MITRRVRCVLGVQLVRPIALQRLSGRMTSKTVSRDYSISKPDSKLSSDTASTNSFGKERSVLRIVKLSEDAKCPIYSSAHAAGADLFSSHDCVIPAKGKCCVSTGIQVALPENCYGRVSPRSGLAFRHFIDVGAGVIDPDYRGELKILLFNFGEKDYNVKKGERIAQLICERFERCKISEVKELDATIRGASGFGSSGF